MTIPCPFNRQRCHQLRFSASNPDYIKWVSDISRYCHPNERYKRIKLFCRSLLWAKLSGQWFQQLSDSTVLSELIQRETGLAEKLHRSVLRLDHPIAKRSQLLSGHYAIVEQLVPPTLLRQILLNGGLALSTLEITPGQVYTLLLCYAGFPGKEGELSLCWQSLNDGSCLAQLSFSLIPAKAGLTVYIGGLQGPSGGNGRGLVAQVSKACSGLSPKRIVMEGLCAFAQQIGAKYILAVADEQQISRRKCNKHFSYNAYWLELGAQRTTENEYELPLHIARKPMQDTPTKRRAKYRQQHAYLDWVYNGVLDAWLAPGIPPALDQYQPLPNQAPAALPIPAANGLPAPIS